MYRIALIFSAFIFFCCDPSPTASKANPISPGTYDDGFIEDNGAYIYKEQNTFFPDGTFEFVDYGVPIGGDSITTYSKNIGTWSQNGSTLIVTIKVFMSRDIDFPEANDNDTLSPPNVSPPLTLSNVTENSFTLTGPDKQVSKLVKVQRIIFSF
jgi:hypothetical protein